MIDSCKVQAKNEGQMRKTGISLAKTIYRRPETTLLRGELGAGKTTFVQGFAEGLGISEHVTSPTYALEQRYGDSVLSHIDLYRLYPSEATEFLRTLDPFPGIRVIEWSDRTNGIDANIEIDIKEEKDKREIQIYFKDIAIPPETEIIEWMAEVGLPPHILRHMRKVAEIGDIVADALRKQGRLVRKNALRSAALTHDLLRFVDFKSLSGDAFYSPSPAETEKWIRCKAAYGTPHEAAAENFLIERGYPEIGLIVRTHRGHGKNSVPETVEQYALSYADKRTLMDTSVTLDERFDDFIIRYGNGKESDIAREWRAEMKRIETFLFPEGAPF